MRPYPFKIAAGIEEPQFFGNDANYVRLDESSSVSVTVKDNRGNQEYTLRPGADVKFNDFEELFISHDGASETAFILWIGKDTSASSSIISGNVQPVGGNDNATNPPIISAVQEVYNRAAQGGRHFIAGTYWAPVVGDYFHFGIYNPAGNIKTIAVSHLIAGPGPINAGVAIHCFVLVGVDLSAWGVISSSNKLIGGGNAMTASPVMEGSTVATGVTLVSRKTFNVNEEKDFIEGGAVIVTPGNALIVRTNAVSESLVGHVEWEEF